MKLPAVGFGIIVFIALLGVASAQVGATISGRVEDPSGAAVSGATVTVKSVETGATRTATTDDGGNFRVLSLPLGPQEVRVGKTGFKTAVRLGINLVVAQEAVVSLRLEVGELAQQVTVTAEAPLVNITTSSVSGLVTEADWEKWGVADLHRYIHAALDSFGPERLMIGSDWPVCTVAAGYRSVIDLVWTAIGDRPEADRDAVLGGTARRFWNLGDVS